MSRKFEVVQGGAERERHKNNVVELTDYQPHFVSEVVCLRCLRRWISVRPEDVMLKDIACLACGPGFVIETGEYFGEVEDED